MPRQYRRYRPRRGRRRVMRKRAPKNAPSWYKYGSTAIAAYNMASKLYGMINSELKYSDTSITTAPTTSWQIFNLSSITEGDDNFNRDGRSILAKNYYIDYMLKSASAATVATVVRVVIFVDRWQAGADATAGDLYNAATVTTLRNISANPERFKILMDKRHILDVPTGAKDVAIVRKNIPLNFHIKYIGTSNVDASDGKNNLYLAYIADQVAANAVTMGFSGRLRFYDN